MIYVKYIAFFIVSIYALLIIYFYYGWYKLKNYTSHEISNYVPISVVIACRNEEENISHLLECLVAQSYPKDKIEIILVNDHSLDNTENIILNFIKDHSQIRLYYLPENLQGKKKAIEYGISKANSDIIITTDADCTMNKDWLSKLFYYYNDKKPKLLSGPVQLEYENNIFQKFQALEFLSLISSGAGAIGVNRAIMCNAANMLFEKSLYNECNMKNDHASGDDIFLMLHSKAIDKESIQFIKSRDAVVTSKAAKKLKDFVQQRLRWTSKSAAYRDFDIIFTAILVALTNTVLGVSIIYSLTNLVFFDVILLFGIKSLADFILLYSITKFLRSSKLMFFFIPLQIIYPFYIIATALFGLTGNFNWKGRKF